MKISIIAVSNSEIVSNEKNDTVSLISSSLHKNGQEVVCNQMVRANSGVVNSSLSFCMEKSDCVLLLCENEFEKIYMCKKLLCDLLSCKMINSTFAKFYIDEYSKLQNVPLKKEDGAYSQMPESARTIKNPFSPFQGCLCEKDGKAIFLLPLTHDELNQMFFSSVLPYILKSVGNESSTFVLRTFGLKSGEMQLLLKDFVKNKLNIEVVCGEYLLSGEIIISIPKSTRKDYADNFVKSVFEKVLPYVYAEKDESMPQYIFSFLSLHKERIAFAEDFTAGNMSANLSQNLEETESILQESYVTISNDAKIRVLGVEKEIFKRATLDYGEIAYQMAMGVLENSSADVVVANCGDVKSGDLTFAIGNRDGLHIFTKKVSGNKKQKIIMATNAIFFELIKKLKQNDFALGKTIL